MPTGRIVRWNDNKGYGFIKPTDGSAEVFLHVSVFASRTLRPEGNELVIYTLARDDRGRPQAINAVYAGSRKHTKRPGRSPLPMLVVLAFFGALGVLVAAGIVPAGLLGLYIAMGFFTFLVYAYDKSAAKQGEWRTSESTLLLLGLAGGWPGALLAQGMLRHKSRKGAFLSPFRVTVLLNILGLWWLTTPQGSEWLARVVHVF